MGNFNLDEIKFREYPEGTGHLRRFNDVWVAREIGGNAGNVAAELALTGWNVYPVVMFDESVQGSWVIEDLEFYGCNMRYVSSGPKGGTFVFQACHNRHQKDGSVKMSHRAVGPQSLFPKRHNLTVRDEAPELLATMDFVPDVCFFGSPEAGHRLVAGGLKNRGSVIVYEIQNAVEENKALRESLAVADIVKMSDEHVTPDMADAFVASNPGKLFIHTLGPDGVRFNLRGQGWIHVPAAPANVVDTEGAGDAMTSAFIDAIQNLHVSGMTSGQVLSALETAGKASAQAISYLGAKGHIHANPAYAHITAAMKARFD